MFGISLKYLSSCLLNCKDYGKLRQENKRIKNWTLFKEKCMSKKYNFQDYSRKYTSTFYSLPWIRHLALSCH